MLMGLELQCGTKMMEQPKICWEPIATGSRQTDKISGISSVKVWGTWKVHKIEYNFVFNKKFKILFIFLAAFYLILWLMRSHFFLKK